MFLIVDPDHGMSDNEHEDDSTDLDPIRLELRATDPLTRTPEHDDQLAWQAEQRRIQRLIHPDGYGWDAAALDDPDRWHDQPKPTEPYDESVHRA